MPNPVVAGAILQCSFGAAPSTLNVLPTNRVMVAGKPAATIMDNVPFVNIPPFGVCSSLPEPITAAQTAAAMGALTPGTCIPTFPGPWVPGSPTAMIGSMPMLNNTCKLICAYGGVVQITFGGSVTENVP